MYLTTNTNSNGGGTAGDLIATLWMSDIDSAVGTVQYGSNRVYVDSNVRNVLKTNYTKFTDSNSNASLQRFLAVPWQVNYQEHECWVWSFSRSGGGSSTWTAYNFPGEAWGTVSNLINRTSGSGGWYDIAGQNDNKDGWKKDYIWLPSMTETGYYNQGESDVNSDGSKGASLWGIPEGKSAIRNSTQTVWMRSGQIGSAINANFLTREGSNCVDYTTATYSVRPALHLNLTKVNDNALCLDEPIDIDVDYNGTQWSMDAGTNISAPTKPAWYDTDKIALTYANSNMIDAGTYTVTATIKDTYKNAGYIFRGTPGTGESDTVRVFSFKINPKKINPPWDLQGDPARPKANLDGLIYTAHDTGNMVPVIGFTYTKKGTTTTYNEWPANDSGTFVVTPRITNPTTCKNYVLADSPTTKEINIKKTVTFNKDTDVLIWQASETGGTANRIVNNKLTYSPKGYVISISLNLDGGGTLASKGVQVSVLKIDGVGSTTTASVSNAKSSYSAVVTLVNCTDYETVSIDITYTFEIEKAKYDLSQVKWNYSDTAFTYDGTKKTIALNDKLPSTLVPTYGGDYEGTIVKATKYKAEISSFANSDSNYVTPLFKDATTYTGSFDWEYEWNIVPQAIDTSTAAWHDKDYNFNGTPGKYPVLDSKWDSIVTYSFEKWNETANAYESIALADIRETPGKSDRYRVIVTTANPNYKVNTDGDANIKQFRVGTQKAPVTITLSSSGQEFNNTPREADFTIGGDYASYVTKSDFTVEYFASDGTTALSGAPTHAGTYKVKISLNSDKMSDFFIESGGELTEFIVNKATVDLSTVKWNYDADNPFQFERKDGANKNHKVELIGWDDSNPMHTYIKQFITYSGEIEESSVKSRYDAHYAIDTSDGALNLTDFNDLESALPAKDLAWKIVKREIPIPAYSGENLVFSNTETVLLNLLDIPADYAEYFTVTVKYNDAPTDSFIAKDIGKYTITCLLRTEPDIQNNVSWANGLMLAPPVNITVDPRIVTISGWTDSAMPSPIVGNESDLDFIERTYTNTNGEPVTITEIANQYNTTFRVTVTSKYGDNVIVREEDGVLDYAEFSTPADPNVPATPVAKPTITNDTLKYTGEAVTFEMSGFDDSIMIMVGSLTVTDAGDYNITVRFRDGVNYCWDDGSRAPITLTIHLVDDPNLPDSDKDKGGESNPFIDFFKKLIEQNFPLWQIATTAVGALLSLIFMIKAIQYGNRKKKANGETKKLNAKTYAALLPVFDTTVVLAGLSNKIWSIIAFAMVGVTALLFIIAIITRKGWKKAELAKEQAIEDSEKRKFESQNANQLALQEKIAQIGTQQIAGMEGTNLEEILRKQREEMEAHYREELARRDEEQAKRDEAMKLMLANLMGRQQAGGDDMPYASMDDTDLLVQKVIAGLLPAVQQMMPEPTAYLSAPGEQNDQLMSLVAEQSEQIRTMTEQMTDLQNQLADMSHNVLDAEIIPDNSEEIRALKEEHNARIDEQNAQIEEQNAQIAELQNRIDELMQGRVEAELLPDQSEEIRSLTEQIEQLKSQIAENGAVVVNADNSEELRALADAQNAKLAQQNAEMQAMSAEMLAMRSQLEALSSMSVDELDDEDFDDEEEWDSILDEDDDDFVEAVIIDDNGKERKVYPNFRMRLKQSSDKNREWYAVIKNLFCSQKGVTYRVYKRVEKIRYQGQVIAVIGIAKRSIKLWLALKPYEYDARRYHHKDVSDKPRFVDVPMYVRVSSDRALDRSQELILALFQELNMEARKRYTDRSIQELIFTLKHNRLLTNKQNKQLLCETMHVHDCDVLDDETAEKCIEAKNVEFIDDSNIETVKLDDIDAKFQDGNRVTLDRLKKVRLVSEDCTGYMVTADKRLTKPLIIVANDFTLTAVKLITLTGGRAIRLQAV